MHENDGEIVKDFLIESYENLDRLERELVGLEKDPSDAAALASIFRTIHTIKGTCGFLGFDKLEAVAHVGENLLTRLRDRLLTLKPEITTALLSMVDAVRQMLRSIEAGGAEGERDDSVYRQIRDLVYKVSGIYKTEEKLYLLVAGCGRRMKQRGAHSPRVLGSADGAA